MGIGFNRQNMYLRLAIFLKKTIHLYFYLFISLRKCLEPWERLEIVTGDYKDNSFFGSAATGYRSGSISYKDFIPVAVVMGISHICREKRRRSYWEAPVVYGRYGRSSYNKNGIGRDAGDSLWGGGSNCSSDLRFLPHNVALMDTKIRRTLDEELSMAK